MLSKVSFGLRRTLIKQGPRFNALACRYCSSEKNGDEKITKKEPVAARPVGADDYKNPWYVLSEEMKNVFTRDGSEKTDLLPVPRETDILVIGGGAIGSSVSYWLKQRHPDGFNVSVVERDPSYTRAATVLSVGGLRQQFSLKENIEMSLFTADFIRNIKEHLSIYGVDPPDVQFNPQGYLFLASEKGAETLHANHKIQKELGAKVQLMNAAELRQKFPWLNTEDIAYGSYGIENEGWFDPWLLLAAMRNKATSLGANYVKGELVGFKKEEYSCYSGTGVVKRQKLTNALVKHDNGVVYPIKFAAVVVCGGPWSGEVAEMAGLGKGDGILGVPLPVEPRKRYVYVLHCPDGPGLETPMIIDPSGVYIRREGLGGHYVCGASPSPGAEPGAGDLTVDYEFYNEVIWPQLAHRASCFECVKEDGDCEGTDDVAEEFYQKNVLPQVVHRVPRMGTMQLKSAWAGFYDYNYFDQNLIVGNHPYHRNLLFATGCSGHGIQQAPAIGRAIMEYIIDDEFVSIDLRRFSFDRVLDNEPIFETNIV